MVTSNEIFAINLVYSRIKKNEQQETLKSRHFTVDRAVIFYFDQIPSNFHLIAHKSTRIQVTLVIFSHNIKKGTSETCSMQDGCNLIAFF